MAENENVLKSDFTENLSYLTSKRSYEPGFAMIFYKESNGNGLPRYRYIEVAEIEGRSGKYRLGPTKPASLDFIRELNNQIDLNVKGNNLRFRGLIPSNILYFDRKEEGFRIMWRCAGGPKKMFFTDMDIDDGEYIMPDLIFDYEDDELKVFAAIDNDVFHIPSFNIDKDGQLCFGNTARLNKGIRHVETFIEKTEQMFFGSKFSHCANDKCMKEPIIPFYQEKLPKFKNKSEWKPYLVSLRKTIDKLI